MPSLHKFFATCGYLGFLPWMPGTFGTLPAMGLFLLATHTPMTESILAVVLLCSCGGCVVLGRWGQQAFGSEDPRPFVLDEFAGYLAAVLFLGGGLIIWKAGLAFLAFRFFDIVKPYPARRLEKLPGGWGILLDDLVAGFYANILVRVVLYYLAATEILLSR